MTRPQKKDAASILGAKATKWNAHPFDFQSHKKQMPFADISCLCNVRKTLR